MGAPSPCAGLEPASFPTVGADLVLRAAAQTFAVDPAELQGIGRAREVMAARAVYVAVGRLEGFRDQNLAAPLGKTPRRVCQIGAGAVDTLALRIVRTLIRDPALRARLVPRREWVLATPG